MLRDTANAHNMEYAILRYFNVAGCDVAGRTGQSTPGATHLIKVTCEAALGKRSSMKIFGTGYDTPDGTCIRDFIHVNDLVNAHYFALRYLRNGGKKFTANCGYSKGFSVREVVETVKRLSGNDFKVIESERRSGDIESITANASRLMNRLDWRPQYDDLDTIIGSSLAWEEHISEFRKTA